MEQILMIIIPLVIVAFAMNKNEFVFGAIISLIANGNNISLLFSDNYDKPSIGVVILVFVLTYICAVIAFKVANKFELDSRFGYIFAWGIIYNLLYYVMIFLLYTTIA